MNFSKKFMLTCTSTALSLTLLSPVSFASGNLEPVSNSSELNAQAISLSNDQKEAISSYLATKFEKLKTIGKTNVQTKEEGEVLVQLMSQVHFSDLKDFKFNYKIKGVNIGNGTLTATIDLYRAFYWNNVNVPTEFKDDVVVTINKDKSITVNLPETSLDSVQVIKNAKTLNATEKSRIVDNESSKNNASTQEVAPFAAYSYNRNAAVNYIDKYWNDYNSAYVTWNNDCTNFASQVLSAGGIKQYIAPNGTDDNPSWYYNLNSNGFLHSTSWVSVDYLYNLMRNYGTIDSQASSFSGVQIGDIIQYDKGSDGDKNHTAIVSSITMAGTVRANVLVSYHTSNRHNITYDYYATENPPTSMYFTHILDTQS